MKNKKKSNNNKIQRLKNIDLKNTTFSDFFFCLMFETFVNLIKRSKRNKKVVMFYMTNMTKNFLQNS